MLVEIDWATDGETVDTDFAEELDLATGKCEISTHSKELLSFEYHVLYHLNYAVPYLCFNAHKSSEFGSINTIHP